MDINYLKLNIEKTGVIFIGKCKNLKNSSVNLDLGHKTFSSQKNDNLKILGIIINENLNYKDTISICIRSCYFNLHKLRSIRHYLDEATKIRLAKTYVINRLDYCNILYSNCTKSELYFLQKVINAAIRFIYSLPKRTSITPYAKKCHILPVKYRLMYKCSLITYKTVNSLCPDYLLDIFRFKDVRHEGLRKSGDILLLKYPTNSNSVYAKVVKFWNELPSELRYQTDINIFTKDLKTFYFRKAFDL